MGASANTWHGWGLVRGHGALRLLSQSPEDVPRGCLPSISSQLSWPIIDAEALNPPNLYFRLCNGKFQHHNLCCIMALLPGQHVTTR